MAIGFFKLEQIFSQGDHKWFMTRTVSMFHNFPVMILSLLVLFDKNFIEDKVYYTNYLSILLSTISTSFFFWDLCYLLKQKESEKDLIYTLHGLFGYLLNCYAFHYNKYHYYVAAVLSWEWSTPLLNYSYYLYKKGKTNTIKFKLVSSSLIIVHFMVRIFFPIYLLFWDIFNPEIESMLRILGASLMIFNVYWMYKLLEKVFNILIKKSD